LILRLRVAYIGAKFGSATITSCPSASRHRATHSLSVEASSTIRARARSPKTFVNAARVVAMRCSMNVPSSVRMQT
jgi:hypothetical protein